MALISTYFDTCIFHFLLTGRVGIKCQNICDESAAAMPKLHKKLNDYKLCKEDSGSQDDDHNFSDLLNLSVCMPSSVIHFDNPIQSSPHTNDIQYSVTNSIGSDISSLANLGSPDSPPRATSPTVEMKELLNKIQQLPQQKSPVPIAQQQQPPPEPTMSKNYFHKIKAKTFYMPLYNETSSKVKHVPSCKYKTLLLSFVFKSINELLSKVQKYFHIKKSNFWIKLAHNNRITTGDDYITFFDY